MTDDRLLQDLGDLARREAEAGAARFDERWDRLAAGTLTPEEDAELRALAAASEEAREAYEAFRPLGAGFQARVVSAAAAELTPPSPRTAPQAEPRETRSRFLPFPARVEVWLGSAAAVAAALFLLLRSPAALAPLPLYTAELTGGTQIVRGGEPVPSNVFVPGSLLTLEVRPQQPVAGPVEARAFISPFGGGGKIAPWQQAPLQIEGGSVRLRGTLGQEIRLSPGAWRVWVIVGRPGRLPPASELLADLRAGPARHADWQAVSADLRVEDQTPP